jgi:EmrB/QacA subfamily drug resistance transporter
MVFAIVSLALLMASVDQSIVATALPALQHDLHTRVNWSSWTITVYALGQLVVMPLAGRASDMYGRKRVFLGAVLLFTVASLCCGLADDVYLLIGLRALQAVGGGAFMPSATGIVADLFGPGRDRAVGMFTSIMPIGSIIGPILGGVFVTYWSWRGIFLVNLPIGIVLLVLGTVCIPGGRRRSNERLDVGGVALLGGTMLLAMFGVGYLGSGASFASPGFVAPEFVAAVLLAGFLRRSARAPHPFIPIRLLHGRGFGVMNLINFLFGCATMGFAALVPLYAEERYGIHILEAGTLLTARAVGMVVISGLAVLLLRRTGYRRPMFVGFAMLAGASVLLAIAPPGISAYAWLAMAAAVSGIGMGVATPASNNATLQMAPTQAAAIAGLRGMFRQSGAITAVSVTTAIMARSSDPGMAQAHIFVVFAVVLLCTLPLVRRVPEHHGRW